jgi:hypothetical protein
MDPKKWMTFPGCREEGKIMIALGLERCYDTGLEYRGREHGLQSAGYLSIWKGQENRLYLEAQKEESSPTPSLQSTETCFGPLTSSMIL